MGKLCKRAEELPESSDNSVNVLFLQTARDSYIFFYSDNHANKTKLIFGNYASNSELDFTWSHADILRNVINKNAERINIEDSPYQN